jgi:hypothetical protein
MKNEISRSDHKEQNVKTKSFKIKICKRKGKEEKTERKNESKKGEKGKMKSEEHIGRKE